MLQVETHRDTQPTPSYEFYQCFPPVIFKSSTPFLALFSVQVQLLTFSSASSHVSLPDAW